MGLYEIFIRQDDGLESTPVAATEIEDQDNPQVFFGPEGVIVYETEQSGARLEKCEHFARRENA